VAARITAQRGESQESADEGEHSGNMFRGDALEVGAAAVGAMGIERKTERHIAGMEASVTLFAAPGHDANATEKVIQQRTALGAARF